MEDPVAAKIKAEFSKKGNPAQIPLMGGKHIFEARAGLDGVYVDNLGNQPFLPWAVFSETVGLLKAKGGQAKKGNAGRAKLGEAGLELDTLEGHIARKVYGCGIGDRVFRRIAPIAGVLTWAGICENSRGKLCLLGEAREEGQDLEGEKSVPLSPDLEKKSLEIRLADLGENLKKLEEELASRKGRVEELEGLLIEKEGELEQLRLQHSENGVLIKSLESQLGNKDETIKTLDSQAAVADEKLSARGKDIEKLQEKLTGKDKRINTIEAMLASTEEKARMLEKKLSEMRDEATLQEQLKANEELLKQMKGTLASKEAEVSRLNDEIRKYRRQQKFAADGLKQIEEQKTSKGRWWKLW